MTASELPRLAKALVGFDVEEPAPRPATRVERVVDWSRVVELRGEASEQISARSQEWLDAHGSAMPDEDLHMMGRSVIRSVVRDHTVPLDIEDTYVKAVEGAIFGFGRMQPLFEIPEAENIEICGWDSVTVQYGDGRRVAHTPVADSDAELVEAVRFLGASATPARPFDDAHPVMTLALGDRFRLHAVGFGLSHRPSIVIRQHTLTDVTLERLAAGGMMPAELAELLRACVVARRSIVISGDQGAGKTVFLRALIDAIPPTERFGTIETDYELLTHLIPSRRNMVAMQARVGMGEVRDGVRVGEYAVADLIPEALRQNLSRLIVGEVRGVEAGAMFEAMQAGTGTMSTTHSHSAASTIDRLASRVARDGYMAIDEAYRQIALNLHLLVHITLVDDTWRGGRRRRFVSEVREMTGGMESGRPVTHLLYSESQGRLDPGSALCAEVGWRR